MKQMVWLFVLVLGVAGNGFSQVSLTAGVGGGMSISSFPKPANDFYGIGYGGGAHVDMNVAPFLTFQLSGDYYTFPADKAKLKGLYPVTDQFGNPTDNFSVSGGTFSIVGVMFNAVGKILTGSAVTPYGLIGAGVQIGSQTDVTVSSGGQTIFVDKAGSSDTRGGLDFGAGSMFSLGRAVTLSVDVRYVIVLLPGSNMVHIPVSLGLTF